MIRHYRFHDIASISIESKKIGHVLGKVLDRHKLYSGTEPSSVSDIKIHLVPLNCERKHKKQEGELSGVCKHKIAVIKYYIMVSEEQIEAFLYHNFTATPFIHLIILPLLHLMAVRRGYLPLHAAGLYSEGKAVMVLGSTATGKSRTHLEMLSRGFTSMGDDWLWVNKELNVFSFFTPIVVSRTNRNLSMLTFSERIKLYLFEIMRILTLGSINIPLRKIPDNCDNIRLSGKLADVFVLKSCSNKKEMTTLDQYLNGEYLDDLLCELTTGVNVLTNEIFQERDLRSKYDELFENIRKHCNCHMLEVRLPYQTGEYEKVLNHILSNISGNKAE